MTLSNCDLCGESSNFLPLPGDPSGKISICGGCGFVLVRERRSVAEIALAWDEIYKSGHYDPDWPGVKARLFYVACWLDTQIGLHGKCVLDIGAGFGNFLEYARQGGAHPVGLDPSSDNCRRIRARNIHCFQGFASDDSPPIGQYDIVTLNWTLENTGDCLAVLRYAKRCLAPGGHVVVATGSRVRVPFKKSLRHYLPQDVNYPHDTHCYRWSDNSIKRAFQLAGLGYKIGWNDYFDRDEMIALAVVDGKKTEDHDDPDEVQDFFANWQTMFP